MPLLPPTPRHTWNSTRVSPCFFLLLTKCENPHEREPNPTFEPPRGQSPSLSITLASSFRNSAFYLHVALDRERHANFPKVAVTAVGGGARWGCPFARKNCIDLVPRFGPFYAFLCNSLLASL